MTDDLVARLREEGLGWGIGPAILCQQAADRIEALEAIAKEHSRLKMNLAEAIQQFEELEQLAFTARRRYAAALQPVAGVSGEE